MTRADIYKIIFGFFLTAITGLLSYIAVTLKELPVQIQRNEKEHAEETRLREGRDESLQRQVSRNSDRLDTLYFHFEIFKATH